MSNPQHLKIDARVCGFNGAPTRILALLNPKTEDSLVGSVLPFVTDPGDNDTVVATDNASRVRCYQILFIENEHMPTAINAYLELKNSSRLHLKEAASDPQAVLQTRKVDTKGKDIELDTDQLNNAHVAVLMIAWAAKKMLINHQLCQSFEDKDEADDIENDNFSLPFVI
jgi:hypothetical protein